MRRAAQALVLCLLVCLPAHMAAGAPSEYQLKAAFLYNFALFTEWPEHVGDTLNLCVYGSDPFGADLLKLEERSVGTRRLSVHLTPTLNELSNCELVFISRSAIGQLPQILGTVDGSPVLTVADSPSAMRRGVAINMITQQNRIAFEANLTAARAQGLNLSSRLLRLAEEVEQ
ncbi:YfiR family protein [Ectothiorhodospira haloalkaliphila]|nr:YfiR family protein [Ectothiorhodospira haloalkaliphila]MCG5507035.1 YfiR family protein [Ectothiorhodospira variabilis]